MMDRVRTLAVAGLLLVGGAVPALAVSPPPPPVCGDAGVLRQVDEIIRARGQAMELETSSVGEVSSAARPEVAASQPPLAHCAVRGHTVGYDTNRYGATPVNEPFIVRYTIELRRNGMFVQVD
jgi:hypothetical protein